MSESTPNPPPAPPEYQALERGVRHLASGATVLPDSPAWGAYATYITKGGFVLPIEAAPLPSVDEVAARAEVGARNAINVQLRADAALQALKARTPAQVDAWIDATVTDIASARVCLKLLARVVAMIARERL